MRNVNRVMLLGNATRDAELRQTHSGKAVAGIRLATSRHVRTAAGEPREESQYHSIVCWDRLAETVSRYVKKGDPLYVEGRLAYRSYTDSDGALRGVVEIVASDVVFLSSRAGHQPEATDDDRDSEAVPVEEIDLEEVPF
jgi:single-strand DNA-binding protein